MKQYLQLMQDIINDGLSQVGEELSTSDSQEHSFRFHSRGINKYHLIAEILNLHEMRFDEDTSTEEKFVSHYAILIKIALFIRKAVAPHPTRYWVDVFDYIHQLLRTSGYGSRSPPIAIVK